MAIHIEAPEPWQARSYAGLIDAHGLTLLRYLQGMLGDDDAAEDVAQDVFTKAWVALSGLRREDRARSWLYAIAANTARTHLSRRMAWKSEPLDDEVEDRPDPSGRFDEVLPTRLEVRGALDRLEGSDREILLLVGYAGFNAVEAAELLEIGVEAARKRWQRACRRFKDALEDTQ